MEGDWRRVGKEWFDAEIEMKIRNEEGDWFERWREGARCLSTYPRLNAIGDGRRRIGVKYYDLQSDVSRLATSVRTWCRIEQLASKLINHHNWTKSLSNLLLSPVCHTAPITDLASWTGKDFLICFGWLFWCNAGMQKNEEKKMATWADW